MSVFTDFILRYLSYSFCTTSTLGPQAFRLHGLVPMIVIVSHTVILMRKFTNNRKNRLILEGIGLLVLYWFYDILSSITFRKPGDI
jgi:hypothetical protein